MTPVLETKNLTRIFGQEQTAVVAVDKISLRLDSGEMLMLMGPSGSGKTTLLAMLGCILKPTSGQIRILGRESAALSTSAQARLRTETIGFVFQGFNLISALTAVENVALPGDFLFSHPGDTRKRAMAVLTDIGLSHRLHYLPENLSAGEKQRVAFARALINKPKIILADEPTANLDSDNRDILVGLLQSAVKEQGVGVIIATHDERIREKADRVIRIEDGRLAAGHAPADMKGPE